MMRIRPLYLSCLILLCIITAQINWVQADQGNWTEEKVGRLAVKADRAAMRKKWRLAIKYGEEMLKGSTVLYEVNDPTYISRLKNLNRYYDKTGRLTEVAERIKQAYELAKDNLDPSHNVATTCRVLYYKLLIAQKKYKDAIPVIDLSISTLTRSKDDQFRKLHYYEQLYALYGLTGQFEKEEEFLLSYIHLHEELIGELKANDGDKDDALILKRLVQNYCRRKMPEKVTALTQKYDLKYICS